VWIALGGVALTVAGLLLDPVFPINKRLWSSSYALFSSGLSALLLALAMLASGRAALNRWFAPLYLLGMNAILGYMVSLLLALAGTQFYFGGASLNAHAFAAMQVIAPDPYLASVLGSLAVLALVIGLLVPLHRRGIHLRL
jgi:predicted acyltransferase